MPAEGIVKGKEKNDGSENELSKSRARRGASHAGIAGIPAEERTRRRTGESDVPACVANQRLRVLSRHALERSAGGGCERGEAFDAECVAGRTGLQRSRKGGAGVGGSGDAGYGRPRSGRSVSRGARAIQRGGAGKPDAGSGGHQRLEPFERGVPDRGRAIPAGPKTAGDRELIPPTLLATRVDVYYFVDEDGIFHLRAPVI